MILKVKHLEMVRAIHEEGTLTRAARRLFISQPALSRRLAKLEARMGTALFERHHKGMTLTREGRRVLDSAERVIDELERAEHDVELIARGYAGTLRMATQCYMCYHWVPWVARRFAETYPKVELELVPEVTRDPYGALDREAIDLALVYGRPPRASNVHLTEIFSDELIAIVAPDHPLSAESYLTAELVRDETLLCHYTEPGRGIFETVVLEPEGVRPRRVMELLVTAAVVEMARAGYGVAVLPRWILETQKAAEELVPLRVTEEGLSRSWFAAVAESRRDEPTLTALVEVLREELGEGALDSGGQTGSPRLRAVP
ncbi:MAG: LysR family transcriptional regulator [Gemmatimonadetes bacterium]|nr:LysR family transcriptional regulator [Gemmatimonadota bacterium]NIR78861.1 LysR family transcriptional regulator [Gemmatimonadota bacterium]NIT87500.1 LysR family transcriptional regulator [Gemmatimonadota bacterium]NIU31369.1 LysR family transcriptional regulator [Gemmatimonadota bacterium]NIU36046.1 LysR family transcriptional regulator [Gemmatimonadota bacterium]